MFYRLLGRLFFYIWVLPILSGAAKMVAQAIMNVSLEKMTELAKTQNNVAAQRLIKDNVRPARR